MTIVPQTKWNLEYTLPAEHCVKTEAGCLQTTYQIHKNAVKLEAEKVGGVKPSDALDSSVRAAYLAGDGVSHTVGSGLRFLMPSGCDLIAF